jgi:DNA repair photolyase
MKDQYVITRSDGQYYDIDYGNDIWGRREYATVFNRIEACLAMRILDITHPRAGHFMETL